LLRTTGSKNEEKDEQKRREIRTENVVPTEIQKKGTTQGVE
jgi:hypothetical protein